jgi:hypothetical protein
MNVRTAYRDYISEAVELISSTGTYYLRMLGVSHNVVR